MSFNFNDHDPKGRKAWFTLPTVPAIGALQMLYAGQTNKGYTNAVARRTAKSGAARKIARGQVDADLLEENIDLDKELFPLWVIVGWRDVHDSKGKLVTFSQKACTDFLAALPAWLMREVSSFAGQPGNFLPESMPTPDEVKTQAGE